MYLSDKVFCAGIVYIALSHVKWHRDGVCVCVWGGRGETVEILQFSNLTNLNIA